MEKMKYHNFKDLVVWQRSKELVKVLFLIWESLDTKFSVLYTQTMKSALSIPSNIAEGCGRGSEKQLSFFLNVAHGSACELETQLIIAFELHFLNNEKKSEILTEVNAIQKMIIGLLKSLKQN
ncbi:MAG: four helix bundle protein [Saprospiraceae bacterium]